MQDVKKFLASLPHHPGVYQMRDATGKILYVGKAKDLKKRVSSYFAKNVSNPKTKKLLDHISDITITVTDSEADAVLLECNLIKQHHPHYNVLLRDDKSYPYIYISSHEFPQIDIYRGVRKKKGRLFGPFPSSLAVREAINLLQKLFKLRTCRDSYFSSRTRPCLLYQIGRCSGPCVGHVSAEQYDESIQHAALFLEGKNEELIAVLQDRMQQASDSKQYEDAAYIRDQIARLRQLQGGQVISTNSKENIDAVGISSDTGVVAIHLLMIRRGAIIGSRTYYPVVPGTTPDSDVLEAFIAQHYLRDESHIAIIPSEVLVALDDDALPVLSEALTQAANKRVKVFQPVRGDKKKWFELAKTNARQALLSRLFAKSTLDQRYQALSKCLELARTPQRMECFDISHTMGEATVASCVVFDCNGPDKASYRRYNITGLTPGDDVAAIQQVIQRRFKAIKEGGKALPDLVIIDGGQAQLNAAANVLHELFDANAPHVISVSKGPGRKAGFESIHQLQQKAKHLPADDVALHLIQQIRDEAHRFAITGHRQRRDKARRQSKLETIPGVGAKKRQALLRYFGGIQGVARASLDELMKVSGISKSIAQRIYTAFHDEII